MTSQCAEKEHRTRKKADKNAEAKSAQEHEDEA